MSCEVYPQVAEFFANGRLAMLVANGSTGPVIRHGRITLVSPLMSTAKPSPASCKAMFVRYLHPLPESHPKLQIAIDKTVFPVGTDGRQLDTLARSSLWQAGCVPYSLLTTMSSLTQFPQTRLWGSSKRLKVPVNPDH